MSEIENLTINQIIEYINSLKSENQRIYNDNLWKDYYINDLAGFIQQQNTKIQKLEELSKNQNNEIDFQIKEIAILKAEKQKEENEYKTKLEKYISTILLISIN
jgi:uncharacterized membrane protein YqiK